MNHSRRVDNILIRTSTLIMILVVVVLKLQVNVIYLDDKSTRFKYAIANSFINWYILTRIYDFQK